MLRNPEDVGSSCYFRLSMAADSELLVNILNYNRTVGHFSFDVTFKMWYFNIQQGDYKIFHLKVNLKKQKSIEWCLFLQKKLQYIFLFVCHRNINTILHTYYIQMFYMNILLHDKREAGAFWVKPRRYLYLYKTLCSIRGNWTS